MSEVKVNKLSPRSGTTVTLGDSGDTISIPSGVTLANSGTIDNLNASNLTSGTVPDARITGAYTGITNLTMSGTLTVGDGHTIGNDGSFDNLLIQSSSNENIEYNSANGSHIFKQNGGEVFRIDDTTGNVGIGVSNPIQKLQVVDSASGSVASILAIQNTNGSAGTGAELRLVPSNYNNNIGSTARWSAIRAINSGTGNGTSLQFLTNSNSNDPATRLTISIDGKVGIGTSAPDGQLHIVGSDTTDQVIIENTDGGTSSAPDLVLFRNSSSPADNDILGRIDFRGDNDAGQSVDYFFAYATATDVSDGTEDAKLQFEAKKAGSNANLLTLSEAEAVFNEDSNDVDFRVESNGISNMLFVDGGNDRVGIGTGNPQNKIDISATTWDDGLLIKNTGNFNVGIIGDANRSSAGGGLLNLQSRWNGTEVAGILFQAGSDTTNKDDGVIVFRTASAGTPTERMRIASDGVVGIGTSSPSSSYRLSAVGGTGAVVGAFIETTSSTSGHEASIIKRPNSGVLVQFLGSGQVGSITTNGSTTTYGTSSDYRLKENIVEITDATARLKQLKPKRFNFIADADTTVDGFIAHEVSSVVPEAIHGNKDEVDADGNPKYQNIDQSKLVPLLVKTIQELEARITTLENA